MVHPMPTIAFPQPIKSQMIPSGVIDGKQILHAFICFFFIGILSVTLSAQSYVVWDFLA